MRGGQKCKGEFYGGQLLVRNCPARNYSGVIVREAIKKQIKFLWEGFKILQLFYQMKEHAKLFKIYFVYSKHQLCGNDLKKLTKLNELKGKGFDNVSEWLAQFLSELMEK